MPVQSEWEDDHGDWQIDEEDEELTVACPYCGRHIHEEAERCPYCENYISSEDAPAARKPWWIVVGVAICLYIVYYWMFG